MELLYLGNTELLSMPKTGFLASGTIAPDKVLAKHYGFTEEELDFIIRSAMPLAPSKNYDIKYRMGDELSAEE